jgi:8-oxo-dGTP pyrophosphatase MutT (NUDIX family)
MTSPDGAPRPAATVLAVVDLQPGLEVLMVRRPPGGMFGEAWVFPGGVVDSEDHDPHLDGDDRVDELALFRRAAVRELAEETGAVADPAALVFVSRWITPAGLPRRYDTRFFLVELGERSPLVRPAEELEEAVFVTPATALAAHEAQHWRMVLPTLTHLRWLARFASVADARSAALRMRRDPVRPRLLPDGSLVAAEIPMPE